MNGALHAQLLRLAARRVGWDEAEDVVQTAYLRVWRHREYGAERMENPRLLARAVVNAARDELRRRRYWPATLPLRPWHGGLGEPEQEALLSIALREAVELAAERPLVLMHALGYSDTEIGQRLGLSRSAVKNRLHRDRVALRALRQEAVA